MSDSPTQQVQGETIEYLEKVQHGKPMLSADKTKDISRQLIERCYQGFSPEVRQTTFALLKRIFNNFKN